MPSAQDQWAAGSGVATGWTGVHMSTPLLPEVDANLVSFYGGEGERPGSEVDSQSLV